MTAGTIVGTWIMHAAYFPDLMKHLVADMRRSGKEKQISSTEHTLPSPEIIARVIVVLEITGEQAKQYFNFEQLNVIENGVTHIVFLRWCSHSTTLAIWEQGDETANLKRPKGTRIMWQIDLAGSDNFFLQ
jgi:hypothetical protein